MSSILFDTASIFRLSGGDRLRRKKATTNQPSIRTYFEPSAAYVATEDDDDGGGGGGDEDDDVDDDGAHDNDEGVLN